MKLSVIIINYNTYNLTCKCIQSVLNKTTGISFEVILVDNASTECNPHLFKEKFPQIELINSNRNLGFAKGNNLGIKHAKGKYILLLNSDVQLLNNGLKLGAEYLRRYPNIGVITGQLQYPDGKIQSNCQRFPSVKLLLLEKLRFHKLLPKKIRAKVFLGAYFNHSYPMSADWVWGTFFMFKRKILDSFPEKKLHDIFFMYIEDMQWCYFIKKTLKKKIFFYPKIKLRHTMGGSAGNKTELLERNLKSFIIAVEGKIKYKLYKLLMK